MEMDREETAQSDMCESIEKSISSVLVLRIYLTLEEELQIHRQFRSGSWKPNGQALWSGMQRKEAQKWADEHDMQTLTTAMGPLMDLMIRKKPSKGWSKYIHGASAIFAWHIAKNERAVVLCPPPPQRFHPSGRSYFQLIEEPILRIAIARGAALCIEIVHPGVRGAEDYHYQLWPLDEVDKWVAVFGVASCRKCRWRMIKSNLTQESLKKETAPKKSKKSKKPKKRKDPIASTAIDTSIVAPLLSTGSPTTKLKETMICTPHPLVDGPIASRTRSKIKAWEQLQLLAFSEDSSTTAFESEIRETILVEEVEREIDVQRKVTKPVECSPEARTVITIRRISRTMKAERRKENEDVFNAALVMMETKNNLMSKQRAAKLNKAKKP